MSPPAPERSAPTVTGLSSTSSSEATLVEGVDYYIESGRWVFTARYHLRRGHCCGSGCRHCPFEPIVKEADRR